MEAAHVELSTVPAYLYAAYSLKTSGYSQWAEGQSAQRTLIGIAIEEMLHLALVRNVMTATGCDTCFKFYDEGFIPVYPEPMKCRIPTLELNLRRISTETVQGFMEIELPESRRNLPEKQAEDQYHTLGELYDEIGEGLKNLTAAKEIDWTTNRWDLQYRRGYWNEHGGPPKPQLVTDLASALDALYIIVVQGEGAPDEQEESHYDKFTRIRDHVDGIGVLVDSGGAEKYTIDNSEVVWPVVSDPKATQFPDGVRQLAEFSDAVYCYVLALLDKIYETSVNDAVPPEGDERFPQSARYGLERGFIAAMQGVLSPVANILVSTPISPTENAGPPFGFYDFGGRKPKDALVELCNKLLPSCPALGGKDGVQHQISLLPEI
ncbi:ferritin-like domain-containing protein [Streptomyces sp. NPDC001667]